MPQQNQKLSERKLQAQIQALRANDDLWKALLVFFAALFLLSAFPFYPLPVVFMLALAAGALAYKFPTYGIIASALLAFPSVAYQSPIFGWLFLLVIAAVLFEAWEAWAIISFLSIVILAPFAPFPISILSGFVMLAMLIAAFYTGSKQSIAISIPAVFLILLLSSLWTTDNSAFMPIVASNYAALPELARDSAVVPTVMELPAAAAGGVASMFSPDNIQGFNSMFGKIFENTMKLLFSDSALIQLLCWIAILFLAGWLPGQNFLAKSSRKQLIASSVLLLVPVMNFAIANIFGIPFDYLVIAYAAASIAIVGILEHYGLSMTREYELGRAEKTKQFGKFGVQDMASSKGADSLADVGGYEDVKDELKDAIVTPLQQKELAMTYGIKPPSGILLFGPPGTGKTLLMRALSKELRYGFYYVKASDLLSEWYGESEKNISELFTIARKNAPCILFFDEIDAIGKKRDSYTTDDVAPRIMALFLQELDGFKTAKNVIVIGATNIPEQLDPALMRPGRFDKIIYMHLPDKDAREAIFKVHCKRIPVSDDVDFKKLAKLTERYSGADIKNICTEATRATAREALKSNTVLPIQMKNFLDILDSIRPSVGIEQLEAYDKFRLDFERRSGKKKDKEVKEDSVRWPDVAGLEGVKQALLEAIEIPLLHEDLMKQLKVKPSKGLLLFGPPGCGKTMIVKAAANELKATFLSVSGADIMKKGYDYGVGIMKETFNRAREQAPALVFIDEIESLAPARSAGSSPILTQLLTELDGVKELKNVMFIGATNKPSMIDPALMRPGRFDKIVYIPQPDFEARKKVFELNLTSVMNDKLGIEELAEVTDGFSGADIASVCQEAKMQVVREKIKGADKFLSTKDILKVIKARRPSITAPMLQEFAEFMDNYGERK